MIRKPSDWNHYSLMRSLSRQKQKLILEISISRISLNVGELAVQIFATPQTVAGQLKQLKDAGIVTAERRGKYSYYSIVDQDLWEYLQPRIYQQRKTQNIKLVES